MTGLAIFGVTGRMGQALLRSLREAAWASSDAAREQMTREETAQGAAARGAAGALRLVGAIASAGSARLGLDAALEGPAAGVIVTADPSVGLSEARVAVDFSVAQCVADNARACAQAGVPLLVGTTGYDAQARGALESAAKSIPVLIAPNTSLGVCVMMDLVGRAAAALGSGYDVEISEVHHRLKRDAPSGTALALGEAVAGVRGRELSEVAVFARHGPVGPRKAGEIGFAVMRAGDIVGEHTVTFATAGERIEIVHRATDRATFARGALRAAEWLVRKPPGMYAMSHVLGLEGA